MRRVEARAAKVNANLRVALQHLRAALAAAGYGPDLLRERLSVRYPDDVGLLNHAPALERVAAGSVAGTALRLFYLESREPATSLRRLFGATGMRALGQAGLIRTRGTEASARLRVDAYANLLLLADRRFGAPDRAALGLPPGDMVYPPGSDSVMLADATPTRDGERVLDLCTGSGIQALSVAGRAAGVIAVDIGERAVAMARANAALNSVSVLDVRCGDLYAPVRGERFDLIVANPPFVPARQRGPAYHSGGPRGDRVLRRVIAGLDAHLRPGGRAIAISHLAVRLGETVEQVVRPWMKDFRGRAVALVLERGTPVDLAAAQALFALDRGLGAYGREVRDWVKYLRRHRIAEVVALLIVAERGRRVALEVRDATPRMLPLPLSQPPPAMVGEWLAQA